MEVLRQIFSSADLTPHGFCLLWREDLLLLNAGADAAIGLSYYAIPIALAYFVLKRRDVAFGLLFWMFAAFILACGTTHWFEIWTIWDPAYGLQGAIKLMTAAVSVATAIAVWGLMPRALALPVPFAIPRSQVGADLGDPAASPSLGSAGGERAAVRAADRKCHRLRHFLAGSSWHRHGLEQGRGTDQGLPRRRSHWPAFFDVLHAGRPGQ